jgi:hypothetical protein
MNYSTKQRLNQINFNFLLEKKQGQKDCKERFLKAIIFNFQVFFCSSTGFNL